MELRALNALAGIAVLCAGLIPVVAFAQQILSVPAQVDTVVSGGTWKSVDANGTYRVIVLTRGFEHRVSHLQVDWVAAAANNNEPPRVVSSKIAETGSWLLTRPRIVQRSGSWRVLVDGIETHFNPLARGTWAIDLGEPGSLKARLIRR